MEKTNRRNILKTGVAVAAGAMVSSPMVYAVMPSEIKPKAAGETRVVYLGGDQLHDGVQQESTMRDMCNRFGWKCISTVDARFVTPELLKDTDLLIVTRWVGGVAGWRPGPLNEEGAPNDGYMSDELEEAMIDNVKNRGMGFMSLHCTIASMGKPKFLSLLGITPMMHGPVQTVKCHNFNQNHPISKGIPDFDLPLDENFGVELADPKAICLYESTGRTDHRHDVAGWCLENGNGRVVGLAAGHLYTPWRHVHYQKLFFRGAHWAMKKDIPNTI